MTYDQALKIWFVTLFLLGLGAFLYSWFSDNKRDREEAKQKSPKETT